jgi:hypothetical protein
MKWIGTETMSDSQEFSMTLAGGKVIVETTLEHSAAMVTGKNIYSFGFLLKVPTGIHSLSVVELQELQASLGYLIDRNLAKLVRLR